jgi:dihydrofolate reductase
MRKLIAAINMTLDGYCDHTAVIADDELHAHYNDMMRRAGTLIYGRVTYQLMESYWPTVVAQPTGNKPIDEFAVLMEDIPKIVYSRTLEQVTWKNSTLKKVINVDEITALKQQAEKDIYVGSPSMVVAFSNLGLVDEYQLCIHPVIAGKGSPLFKNISHNMQLSLVKTKTLAGGQVVMYYNGAKE